MRNFLLLPLLLLGAPLCQDAPLNSENSYISILAYKYSKTRQVPPAVEPVSNQPAPAMIAANKNYPRNARINDPMGARDPNLDTIDGRSAALDRAVQESRTVQPKPVDGYTFRAKIRNEGNRGIEIVFWEYVFSDPADPNANTRRQFLCGVNIGPNKEKELVAFSRSGPSDVVDANVLTSTKELRENAVINRVEYADGSIWQRKDWKFAEIRLTYQRAVATPWGKEMCRGL